MCPGKGSSEVGVVTGVEAFPGAAQSLIERLSRRGWTFAAADSRVVARKHEWPAQLHVVIDFAPDAEMALALVIDMGAMPLGGERFRDIFNNDREQSLRGFGNFTVRQVLMGGGWSPEIKDNAFLHGANTGISRSARLVCLDRGAEERGQALAERFITESNRFVETGYALAATLQRVYQRTVLSTPSTPFDLPGMVAATTLAPAEILQNTYPWRR